MADKEKGQVLVEFAVVAAILLGMLFAIVDLAFMFYVNLTMQNAVREGTRYAITGQGNPDRMSALIQQIKKCSDGFCNVYDRNLHVPKDPQVSVIDPAQVTFTNYSGHQQSSGAGSANDVIVVSLTYTGALLTPILKPFFPNGQYTFTVKTTMKNENFPTN